MRTPLCFSHSLAPHRSYCCSNQFLQRGVQRQDFDGKEYNPAKRVVAIATPNGVEIVSGKPDGQDEAAAQAMALAQYPTP